jgi:hypothetical protein
VTWDGEIKEEEEEEEEEMEEECPPLNQLDPPFTSTFTYTIHNPHSLTHALTLSLPRSLTHFLTHSLTAVGVAVLWLTYASQLDPSEISALVAKGSFR